MDLDAEYDKILAYHDKLFDKDGQLTAYGREKTEEAMVKAAADAARFQGIANDRTADAAIYQEMAKEQEAEAALYQRMADDETQSYHRAKVRRPNEAPLLSY